MYNELYYLIGTNELGFAIMDIRFRNELSIEEFSIKTEHSVRYLTFIEQYHVLKKTLDLYNFGIFIEEKDLIKFFKEYYGIKLIPTLDVLKDQLLETGDFMRNIYSKSRILNPDNFKIILIDKIQETDSEVNLKYQESEYFSNLQLDLDWRNKSFNKIMNSTFNMHQKNRIINLNDLNHESTVSYYNEKIISNKNRKKILGILEILLNDDN